MPELPEIETIRRCLATELIGRTVTQVHVRNRNLRWPVPSDFADRLRGKTIRALERRAKYLLMRFDSGTAIFHLGMSGRLLLATGETPLDKHDHLELILDHRRALRMNDARRFGCVLWASDDPKKHPLLANLGPEPLEHELTGKYLFSKSRGRSVAVKEFLMNSRIVAGIGNIYANEILFSAGIHPGRKAGRISRKRYNLLSRSIKEVLERAIDQGGTTLKDFRDASGNPGYFQVQLRVYGRAGQPCGSCGTIIKRMRQGQRTSYYCKSCQH